MRSTATRTSDTRLQSHHRPSAVWSQPGSSTQLADESIPGPDIHWLQLMNSIIHSSL